MEVKRLERSKLKQTAVCYARTFFNYPQFVCYHPNREWRRRHFTAYCELGLDMAFRHGELYATPGLEGIIGWFPPGKTHFTTAMWLKIPRFYPQAIIMGWKTLSRIITCDDYAAKVHEEIVPGPHWYLWSLEVVPEYQGQGIGTLLMEPGLKRADQQGLPVYLETHDEQNIAYYQKRGFELVRSERVPGVGLPFWCLVHPPKG